MRKVAAACLLTGLLALCPAAAYGGLVIPEPESETEETILTKYGISAALEAPEDLHSHSAYCLMDAATGRILLSENADGTVYPASTTKIMTVLAILEVCDEQGISLDEPVEIRQEVLDIIPASLGRYGIEAGESYSLDTLLHMAMIGSFGDATYCAAAYVFGDISACIDRMNEITVRLGLTGTSFDNVAGLDWDRNYTTAREMALITRYAMGNGRLMAMAGTASYTVYQTDGTEGKTVPNTNALLTEEDYAAEAYQILGTKTGTTSGYVLAALAEDSAGRRVISTYFGTGTSAERFEDSQTLLDLAFAHADEIGLGAPCKQAKPEGTAQTESDALTE